MKLNGGQALIKSLEMEGVEVMFGLPGGAILPVYDPHHRLADPPHPRAPRAGRRPHGRGLRPRHGPPGRRHGDQRAGGHQHRHAAVRRLHGLDPDGGHHRAGADGGHRHRRLPGVRHRRHHPVGHQAQRPGHRGRRTSRAPSARRSTSPPRAGPVRCWSTSPRTSSIPEPTRPWTGTGPSRVDLPGYKPTMQGPPPDDQGGGRADPGVGAAGHLRRRRHPQGPGGRGAARAGRADPASTSSPR